MPTETTSKTTHVRIKPTYLDKLDALAKRTKRSMTAALEVAIDQTAIAEVQAALTELEALDAWLDAPELEASPLALHIRNRRADLKRELEDLEG